MKKTKLIRIGTAVITTIIFIAALSFTEGKIQERQIDAISIDISSGETEQFITEVDIKECLNDFYPPTIEALPVSELDFQELDSLLSSFPFVKNCESYVNLTGVLYLSVEQQTPLLRIINKNKETYYLNHSGHKMPMSSHQTARVPVATGFIDEGISPNDCITTKTISDLHIIAQYLDKHTFFKALTGQFFVAENGDILLITKAEERHDIVIGDAENLDEKFDKLMQFYTKVLSVKGWDTYRTINLKFRNQIVAK